MNSGCTSFKSRKSLIPRNCTHQKQWVFKVKCTDIFKPRLVVCDYNKIPDIDFSENCLQVMHKVTFMCIVDNDTFEIIIQNY